MNILGISYSLHESAACLVQDGKLVFAIAEERLSRKKQDAGFPVLSIEEALKFGGIKANEVDHVAYGWSKPGETSLHNLRLILTGKLPLTLSRLERTLLGFAKEKKQKGGSVEYERKFGLPKSSYFINHHLAHALSAFIPSGFEEATVIVIDGRGAREASTVWKVTHAGAQLIERIDFPNSIGVFYAGVTHALGFQPLSDEWKVMGLASYGKVGPDLSPLMKVSKDSYSVAHRHFYGMSQDFSGVASVLGLEDAKGREPTQREMDVAFAAQKLCEEAMIALVRLGVSKTGIRNVCLAGGVALNCKANGEILRSGYVDNIFVQPASGDDGACIGAAFAVYNKIGREFPKKVSSSAYLGTSHSDDSIEKALVTYKVDYLKVKSPSKVAAKLLADNMILGWFQGRMEFGPRALGGRSILANATFEENRDRVNEAVKFREGWRPFAPSVLEEMGGIYFKEFYTSPHMILSFWATEQAKLRIPAVVHVDGSCRVQSVTKERNPVYYELLAELKRITGEGACMNTSFNLKGDAIVESPKDAIQTFFSSGLDFLVIGSFVVGKKENWKSLVSESN